MTRTMRNKPGPSDFVQLLSVTLIAGLYYVSTLATRPFIPLYAGELGATPVVLGLVVSMYAFLPIFIALPAGKFVDRFGPRPVMLGGASSMIVGSVFYLAAGNLVVLAGGQLL
ncbi:MAG: MFS transporter, partial [Bacillota bacterium]